MSRVRALDAVHDWEYGKGQNNYKRGNAAVTQNIDTRLNSFLGDCFFDTGAGLDWFTYLSSKDRLSLNLAVSAVILNTQDVTGIRQLFITLDPVTRLVTIAYRVQTTYSQTAGTFQFDLNGSG